MDTSQLKKCGVGVQLNEFTKICKPEVVEIGHYTKLCDFVFIWGGRGVKIGKYCDLQPQVTIWGGGELLIGNYVSVGPGTVLLTAVYSHKEGLRMVDRLPEGQAHALYQKLIIEDDVYIGANCTIMPGITIRQGSLIGANSFINKDTEPWSINAGSPGKKIGMRPQLQI